MRILSATSCTEWSLTVRGDDQRTADMFSYLSPEERVRLGHPLRAIRVIPDTVLKTLSPRFARMYSEIGRPSSPPEQVLRALLLQALCTIRRERLLMEEIDYSILFRWFSGLSLGNPIWSPTTLSKNRDRLLPGDSASAFFDAVLDQARAADLLSDERFTVDGPMLEAWASRKSFRRKDADPAPPPDDPGNPTVNFHEEPRKNDPHASTTDPDARLDRKGQGKEAKLVANVCATAATGTAEREAALESLRSAPGAKTVGGDKNFDVAGFVAKVRELPITPHVAPKSHGSGIDGRTTRHAGSAVSQRKRKLIEHVFGWMKTVGGLRKLRRRGGELVDWIVTFTAAAYNLIRLRRLLLRA
jgi:transposase